MSQTTKTNFILRHGIANPLTVTLDPAEVAHLAHLPVDHGLDYLLNRLPNANGFAPAFRETLRDYNCIIEIRQGEQVRVITRKQLDQQVIPSRKNLPMPDIEIGISKAQAGGSSR